ncbi:MAG: deoxyribodipyrimidine photo-lyase [Burkholderiaceae bacterium]|jgi:deoxyribodipyrimidine photo-lyase|nr:deoxyribodipyrimidine photo-lyase [Burkholderiaceae bacterium]
MSCSYLWLKDDFRISNNQALQALIDDENKRKCAIYIYNRDSYLPREAQQWWLAKSLEIFKKKLENLNISLDVIHGIETKIFKKLINSKPFNRIYWNKSCDINENIIEENVKKILNESNIIFKEFKANLLNPVEKIKKDDGTPFKVFTHYWKKAEQIYLKNNHNYNENIYKNYNKNSKKDVNIQSIYPKKNWYKKFEKYWEPSEENAKKILNDFIKNSIEKYAINRDIPSIEGTSKLSPYLKFGQISVHQIMQKCLEIKNKKIGYRKYINEIGWREFSHSLLHNFSTMQSNNLRKDFDNFKWNKNEKLLIKWKKGLTGYPIVDAGMRELYETGWMHNRVRMIVASFLVKHLRIHWLEGEKYFRDTLLDFNLANNVAGWQWVAGTGADAAPYFRIFNPILQGEKFDAKGYYIKKWCPELKNIPDNFLHKPWEMPKELQNKINVIIGKNYPFPIVNHEEARNSALKAFKELRR